MRRIVAALLLLALLLPAIALGGELPGVMLPSGTWTLLDGGVWSFVTEGEVPLNPELQALAVEMGLVVIDAKLMSGTMLLADQLMALYPGAEGILGYPGVTPAESTPRLDYFGLTGEWFYGDDGILYYRHDRASRLMTMDEVFAALNGTSAQPTGDKVIYLTIDDAPSHYTMDLLAMLDLLDIKATFFVVGAYVKNRPVFMRAIYEQGHVIANHSYSHDAEVLTSSVRACVNDFKRCEQAVANALGFALPMPILRIPYGASTLPVSFRTALQENGYLWIDWNALNGDTESSVKSDEDALERAFSTAARMDGSIVMLVHDGKQRTIRTLPQMVEHFRSLGYEFRTLDTNIERIPGVRMGYPK